MADDNGRLVSDLRKFLTDKRAQRAELVEEQKGLQDRLEFLNTAPLGKDDVRQFIADYIDARRNHYASLGAIKSQIWNVLHPMQLGTPSGQEKPMNLAMADRALAGDTNVFFTREPNFFTAGRGNQWLDYAALFFFGDAIKEQVLAAFDDNFPGLEPGVEAGPPVKDRREEIATISARLEEISTTLAEIDGELQEVLEVPEDPEVVKARKEKIEAEAARAMSMRILREYNGRNADELAQKYGLSATRIRAICESDEGHLPR